jgi:hypothetical protein
MSLHDLIFNSELDVNNQSSSNDDSSSSSEDDKEVLMATPAGKGAAKKRGRNSTTKPKHSSSKKASNKQRRKLIKRDKNRQAKRQRCANKIVSERDLNWTAESQPNRIMPRHLVETRSAAEKKSHKQSHNAGKSIRTRLLMRRFHFRDEAATMVATAGGIEDGLEKDETVATAGSIEGGQEKDETKDGAGDSGAKALPLKKQGVAKSVYLSALYNAIMSRSLIPSSVKHSITLQSSHRSSNPNFHYVDYPTPQLWPLKSVPPLDCTGYEQRQNIHRPSPLRLVSLTLGRFLCGGASGNSLRDPSNSSTSSSTNSSAHERSGNSMFESEGMALEDMVHSDVSLSPWQQTLMLFRHLHYASDSNILFHVTLRDQILWRRALLWIPRSREECADLWDRSDSTARGSTRSNGISMYQAYQSILSQMVAQNMTSYDAVMRARVRGAMDTSTAAAIHAHHAKWHPSVVRRGAGYSAGASKVKRNNGKRNQSKVPQSQPPNASVLPVKTSAPPLQTIPEEDSSDKEADTEDTSPVRETMAIPSQLTKNEADAPLPQSMSATSPKLPSSPSCDSLTTPKFRDVVHLHPGLSYDCSTATAHATEMARRVRPRVMCMETLRMAASVFYIGARRYQRKMINQQAQGGGKGSTDQSNTNDGDGDYINIPGMLSPTWEEDGGSGDDHSTIDLQQDDGEGRKDDTKKHVQEAIDSYYQNTLKIYHDRMRGLDQLPGYFYPRIDAFGKEDWNYVTALQCYQSLVCHSGLWYQHPSTSAGAEWAVDVDEHGGAGNGRMKHNKMDMLCKKLVRLAIPSKTKDDRGDEDNDGGNGREAGGVSFFSMIQTQAPTSAATSNTRTLTSEWSSGPRKHFATAYVPPMLAKMVQAVPSHCKMTRNILIRGEKQTRRADDGVDAAGRTNIIERMDTIRTPLDVMAEATKTLVCDEIARSLKARMGEGEDDDENDSANDDDMLFSFSSAAPSGTSRRRKASSGYGNNDDGHSNEERRHKIWDQVKRAGESFENAGWDLTNGATHNLENPHDLETQLWLTSSLLSSLVLTSDHVFQLYGVEYMQDHSYSSVGPSQQKKPSRSRLSFRGGARSAVKSQKKKSKEDQCVAEFKQRRQECAAAVLHLFRLMAPLALGENRCGNYATADVADGVSYPSESYETSSMPPSGNSSSRQRQQAQCFHTRASYKYQIVLSLLEWKQAMYLLCRSGNENELNTITNLHTHCRLGWLLSGSSSLSTNYAPLLKCARFMYLEQRIISRDSFLTILANLVELHPRQMELWIELVYHLGPCPSTPDVHDLAHEQDNDAQSINHKHRSRHLDREETGGTDITTWANGRQWWSKILLQTMHVPNKPRTAKDDDKNPKKTIQSFRRRHKLQVVRHASGDANTRCIEKGVVNTLNSTEHPDQNEGNALIQALLQGLADHSFATAVDSSVLFPDIDYAPVSDKQAVKLEIDLNNSIPASSNSLSSRVPVDTRDSFSDAEAISWLCPPEEDNKDTLDMKTSFGDLFGKEDDSGSDEDGEIDNRYGGGNADHDDGEGYFDLLGFHDEEGAETGGLDDMDDEVMLPGVTASQTSNKRKKKKKKRRMRSLEKHLATHMSVPSFHETLSSDGVAMVQEEHEVNLLRFLEACQEHLVVQNPVVSTRESYDAELGSNKDHLIVPAGVHADERHIYVTVFLQCVVALHLHASPGGLTRSAISDVLVWMCDQALAVETLPTGIDENNATSFVSDPASKVAKYNNHPLCVLTWLHVHYNLPVEQIYLHHNHAESFPQEE